MSIQNIASIKDASYQGCVSAEKGLVIGKYILTQCPTFLDSIPAEIKAEIELGQMLRFHENNPAQYYKDGVPCEATTKGATKVDINVVMGISQQEFGRYRNDDPVKHGIHKTWRDKWSDYKSNRMKDLKGYVRDAKNVLELGCGKGFNSCFLAQQYPAVQFTGIDLTPLHIKIASRKGHKFSNLSFQQGNFNHLNFLDQSFDIVFAFECLCYASPMEIALAEIFRVLRPGGQLIIFDGYRQIKLEKLPKLVQTAIQLTEMSMAVSHGFVEVDNWNTMAQSIGFRVKTIEDISLEVLPTLLKFQKSSMKVFDPSWKVKILVSLLPKYLIRNSIAGLLMPLIYSTNKESLGYYKFILERPLEEM